MEETRRIGFWVGSGNGLRMATEGTQRSFSPRVTCAGVTLRRHANGQWHATVTLARRDESEWHVEGLDPETSQRVFDRLYPQVPAGLFPAKLRRRLRLALPWRQPLAATPA